MITAALYWLGVLNATCVEPPLGEEPARLGGADVELSATSPFGAFRSGAPFNSSLASVPCIITKSEEPGLVTCIVAMGAPISVALDQPPVMFETSPSRSDLIAKNATSALSSLYGVTKLRLLLPNVVTPPACPEGVRWAFNCDCVDVGMAVCANSGPRPAPVKRCRRAFYSMDADPFGATAAVLLIVAVMYSLREVTGAALQGVAAMLPVSAIVTQLPAVTAGQAGAAAAAAVMLGAHGGGLAAFGPSDTRVGIIVAILSGAASVAVTHSAGAYAVTAFTAGAGAAVAMSATLGHSDTTKQTVASTVLGMAAAPLVACTLTAAQTAAPEMTAAVALAISTLAAAGCAIFSMARPEQAKTVDATILVVNENEPVEETPVNDPFQLPIKALTLVAAAAAMAPAYWPGVFRTTFAYAGVVILSTVADVVGRAFPGGTAAASAVLSGVMALATAINVAGESSDLSEILYAAIVVAAAFSRGTVISLHAIDCDPAGRLAIVRAMILGGVIGALCGAPALVVWQ